MIELYLTWLSYFVNIIVVLGWSYNLYRKYYKKRFLSNFLEGENISIYFPIRNANRNIPMIAHEDFNAASHIANFIENNGLIVDFKQINPDGSLNLITDKNASIVICGPKTSKEISTLIQQDPKYDFISDELDKWYLLDRETKNRFFSPMDMGENEKKDIAYVAKLKRSPSSEKNFLLIAGVHAAGSMGAAHYLSNYNTLKNIHNEVNGSRFSMAISSSFKTEPFTLLTSEIFLPIKKH